MFRSINNEKIGNVLNYLASNIPHLSMTKTLKLLYIIDETAIKETGALITWLDYKVWGDGPVAIEIYNEIKRNEILSSYGKEITIKPYVALEKIQKYDKEEVIFLKPKEGFDQSIFNKYELNLLEAIVHKYGSWSARQLVDFLHKDDSLWYKTVKQHKLEDYFLNYNKITNYSIQFTELIEDNPILMMANQSALDYLEFRESLLGQVKS
ncbi:MAG: Panacea domain-containing protein [Flavobacterium sp.]